MGTVTRMELVEHIEAAFGTGPARHGDPLTAATASHARSAVLARLQRLPDIPYRNVRDLWAELGDVPVNA